MALKKKDFIEIEFTGRTKDENIFDSNIKENIENPEQKKNAKPFIYSLDENMFLKGIDEYLIGKEIGKYKIELNAEKAFGKRDPKLIQRMPIKVFHAQQLNPVPGIMFNFDGKIARVLTVSGGRVMVDFNNPLAGKEVVYEINILKKVDDQKEQINALNDFLFRKEFEFEIKEKKIIMKVEKGMKKFVEMFKDKYKDIFDLELVAEEPVAPNQVGLKENVTSKENEEGKVEPIEKKEEKEKTQGIPSKE